MNNPYYVITFDDVYLDAQSQSGQTIHGRLILLAQIPLNQSQSYEYTYQLAGGRSEWAFIFDDIIIQQIISQINIYGKGDSKRLADILDSYSDEYWDAHVGLVGVSPAWLPLVADSSGPYVSLDPNYLTPSSNNSNKVLRTLATGQSDITRHEAYTKVTGLNEFNSLIPSYTNNNANQILKQMLEIVKRSVPEVTKIILLIGGLLSADSIYDQHYVYIGAIEQDEENTLMTVIASGDPEGPLYDCISVGCLTDPNNQYTVHDEFLYLISTRIENTEKLSQQTLNRYEITIIPVDDLTELYDLSQELINTNVDLYYWLGGK